MAATYDRLGGRTIELLIPFETQGRKIDAIHLKAVMFDHTLRWQRGAFASSLALLAALSGENEGVLRMLRYPDVDRVLGAMMDMLPEAIRNDITAGVIPKAAPAPLETAAAQGNGNPYESERPQSEEEPFTGIDR